MPALTTVVTHATGDVFPATDWNINVRDNINFFAVAGATLASAASVVTTNEFHQISGTTQIDNISPATPVAGQQVRLLFQGALNIRNNGGGTGNIRTLRGVDRTVVANEIVTFVYDGAVWRESTGAASIKVTTSTLAGGPPASPADGDFWVATNVDGAGGRWFFQYDSGEATYKWKFLGGAPFYVAGSLTTVSGNATAYYDTTATLTLPRAGDWEITWASYGNGAGGGGVVSQLNVAGTPLQAGPTIGNSQPTGGALYKATGLSASTVAKVQGNHVNGQTYSYAAWLEARPVKVI